MKSLYDRIKHFQISPKLANLHQNCKFRHLKHKLPSSCDVDAEWKTVLSDTTLDMYSLVHALTDLFAIKHSLNLINFKQLGCIFQAIVESTDGVRYTIHITDQCVLENENINLKNAPETWFSRRFPDSRDS